MNGLRLCFDGPTPVPDTTSNCPDRDQHTPAPSGYLAWHEWAAEQGRAGRRQYRCPGCGLFTIWRSA